MTKGICHPSSAEGDYDSRKSNGLLLREGKNAAQVGKKKPTEKPELLPLTFLIFPAPPCSLRPPALVLTLAKEGRGHAGRRKLTMGRSCERGKKRGIWPDSSHNRKKRRARGARRNAIYFGTNARGSGNQKKNLRRKRKKGETALAVAEEALNSHSRAFQKKEGKALPLLSGAECADPAGKGEYATGMNMSRERKDRWCAIVSCGGEANAAKLLPRRYEIGGRTGPSRATQSGVTQEGTTYVREPKRKGGGVSRVELV